MEKFKKILVVYTERPSEKHLEAVDNVVKTVKECSVVKSRSLKKSDFKDVDLVISVGGDGTFIRAAHFVNDCLILGINSEPTHSEGGLMSINGDELDVLKEILDGNYDVIKRERLTANINGKPIKEHAVNEIYIGTASNFHTARYSITFNGKKESHRSSGVIVSCGSGSSAWYKSAGGKPFHHCDKKLKFLVREPFSRNLFKPSILKGELGEGEKICFESQGHYGGAIAIDSNKMYEFKMGDIVEVFLSDQPLNVIVK